MTSRARIQPILISVAVIVATSSLVTALSPLVPKVSAATATSVDFSKKDLPFTRINRTLITVGDKDSGVAYFYASDPAGDNKVYKGVGLTCPATLTYAPSQTYSDGMGTGTTIPASWTIEWTAPYESQEGCQTVKSTAQRTDDPKNNGVNERLWTVFYKDGDKINSVLGDNKTTFTKRGAWQPTTDPPHTQDVYIEDGVQAVDCPSVIRYSTYDSRWVYIPMTKASTGENASDQYASLMNRAFDKPISDIKCTPTDKDELSLFKRFGLPESYYNRGNDHGNDVTTDFGFRDAGNHDQNGVNANLYGAVLLGGIPDESAAGLAANGPNPNGQGIGNGKGIVDESVIGGDETTTTCGVEGIGWIVCPVMNFMSGLNDTMYTFLAEYFLEVKPTIFTDSTADHGLYAAWNTFRGYANVLFVVAFLIIIYSQVTSVGITNYGIKKLLPKLIIAAILVNVSYYICQIAVDISNILGWGIKSLFTAIGGGDGAVASTLGNNPWGTVITSALAVTGAIGIFLALSVPVILAGLLSLLMIVVILVARQAIIILLIAISPLAFVAWLLPNTEKWFKKWWDIFFAMLMLFPIIGALYGAGALAASILGTGDFGPDGGAAKIAALGASILPLAATIPLLQGSLKATGALGAKLSGWSGKANARIGSKVKDTTMAGALQKQYTRQRNIKRAQILGGQKGVGGFINRRINRMTGSLGKGIAATGASTALKMRNEDVENAVAQMQSQWQPHEELDKAEEAYAEALKKGDVTKARAAQKILLSKGGAGVARIRKTIEAGERTGSLHADAASAVKSDLASAGLKGKDAGLNTWSYDTRSLSTIDGDKDTYDKLTDEELSTQTSLDRAHRAGALGGGRASRILGNKDLHGNLTQDKFDVLGRAASGNPPPSPTPPTPPTPSDARLKKDITYIGTNDLGLRLYKFRYSSGSQFYVGVMAQDVILTHPHAVSVGPDGYYRVDYSALGIRMTAID